MATAAAAQYCHILKADKTTTEFLTRKEDYGWPQILGYKETDLLSLPYFIIQHLNHKTFKFIKIKSQEVRQEVWNSCPLSLITLCIATRQCDGL